MRLGIIQKLLAIVLVTMVLTLFLAKVAHRSQAGTFQEAPRMSYMQQTR